LRERIKPADLSSSSTVLWTAKAGQRLVFRLCFDFISSVNYFVLAINTVKNYNNSDKVG